MRSENLPIPGRTEKADLHFHTTLSDGGATSAEAVEECVRNGVAFAVATEHDVVNREFPALATKAGIRTLEGVEVSARAPVGDGKVKHLHLTAYAHLFVPQIDPVLTETRIGRVTKMRLQCEDLARVGFDIDHARFLAHFENGGFDLANLTNFHLAEYLVSRPTTAKIAKSIAGVAVTKPHDFIGLFLKRESPFPVGVPKNFPEYEPEAVKIARIVVGGSHGVLSVAHPNFTFAKEGTEAFENGIAENLVETGINGIELNPHATPEWTETVLRVKKRFGLVLTFGSDCHFLKNKTGDGRHSAVGETHAYLTGEKIREKTARLLAALG